MATAKQIPAIYHKPPPGIPIDPIVNTRRIAGTHLPETWLHLFHYLEYRDQRLNWIGCLGFVGFFLGFVGIFLTGSVTAFVFFAFLMIVISLLTITLANLAKRPEMASRLTKSVLPIVRILRADMRPGVPITLWIDLNGAEMPKKQVNRVDHGDAKNTIDTFYIHRWLVGKARLADRSQVQWQITDYLRNRSTTFRRTGGRVKTKVKPKTKMVINLWLNVPMRLYPNVTATPTQTSDNKLHLKEKPRYISIRLKQKYRYAQPGISVHLFRQTIGQAYRQITPPQQSVSYTGATRVL